MAARVDMKLNVNRLPNKPSLLVTPFTVVVAVAIFALDLSVPVAQTTPDFLFEKKIEKTFERADGYGSSFETHIVLFCIGVLLLVFILCFG